MSEALPNPLMPLHEQAGAETQPYGPTPVVSTFGQPELEYAAIRKGAAVMDLPQRGVIELTGRDRLAFLNNLLTNQTHDPGAHQGLLAGEGVYAFLLTAKGRIVADINVLERGNRTLLELDGRMVPQVLTELEKYRFAEQVKLASRVGVLHEIALHGPKAIEVLRSELPGLGDELQPLGSVPAMLFRHDVIIWRDDVTGAPGYHLIVPADAADVIWTMLINRFPPRGLLGPWALHLRPVGWAAFNSTRIEAGRAIFGVDYDESVLPAETSLLERAVSFTKGCYVGQEIVARMHSRGQVARKLVGIRMDDDALPIAGTKILDEHDNEVGGITSSTVSPLLSGAAIALGYVKRPLFEPGTQLRIPAEGSIRTARVADLPFLRV